MSTRLHKMAPKAVTVITHQGRRVSQEDYVLVHEERGIFVVADGFGGPGPGFEAAQIACKSVKDFLVKEAGDLDATLPFVLRSYYTLVGNVLFNALVHANRSLLKVNQERSVHERGGASVLAGYMSGNDLALVNAGVCSAALLRGGRSKEVVTPRSYARFLNPISPEQEMGGGIPLMALGLSDDLEPEVFEMRVHEGDWVLMYSDGFPPDLLSRFEDLQLRGLDAQLAAKEAVNYFNEYSDIADNASFILAFF